MVLFEFHFFLIIEYGKSFFNKINNVVLMEIIKFALNEYLKGLFTL